ncbi:reverse transcriptase [Elysia marginata]|uniref:Reverse transcriptase n=1 Tax=Elysia marginata TaxID=1093978 RepID=A0AAV4IJK7_9GAST|nr:reverse transcriptase [Elysia marginata]
MKGYLANGAPENQLSHQIVYDLLPSNANLVRWGKKDDHTRTLCHGRQTTERVLSSCKVVLSQGRYTWRHNRVLQELASAISTAKDSSTHLRQTSQYLQQRAGLRHVVVSNQRKGLLGGCDDWEVSADLQEWVKRLKSLGKPPTL